MRVWTQPTLSSRCSIKRPVSEHPFTISLNEVCEGQFTTLRNFFTACGYTYRRDITKANASSCSGQSYGNVVFAAGSLLSSQAFTLSPTTDDAANGESRKIGCVTASFFSLTQVSCSIHITNDDQNYSNNRTYQQQQSDQAAYFAGLNYPNVWRIVGGDFNMPPEEAIEIRRFKRCQRGIAETVKQLDICYHLQATRL